MIFHEEQEHHHHHHLHLQPCNSSQIELYQLPNQDAPSPQPLVIPPAPEPSVVSFCDHVSSIYSQDDSVVVIREVRRLKKLSPKASLEKSLALPVFVYFCSMP